MALGSKLPLAARENEGYYSFPRKKKKNIILSEIYAEGLI